MPDEAPLREAPVGRWAGANALVVNLTCQVADYRDAFATIDDFNMEINRRFAAEGLEMPFPQHDVHIRSGKLPS